MVYPTENFQYRGFYTFKYFIRGQDGTQIAYDLTIKVIDLKDAFEIGSGEVNLDLSSMKIYVHNRESHNFEKVKAKFESPFFEFEKTFSLGPNERKEFEIELNKQDFNKLTAGFYTLKAEFEVDDEKTNLEGTIKFAEKDLLKTTKESDGFIINTQTIKKTNEGNLMVGSETVVKKNIISRLFTTMNPEPDIVERDGFDIYYTWANEIKPGESSEVMIKTNWTLPLVIMLFVIVSVILAKQYTKTNLSLRKRVSFVKAKGGEFALKITISATANNQIEKISVIDRVPPLVKIYERFGSEKPKRVNEKTRRIEWEFNSLQKGETRVLSYVIYSKIGVLGKFALPTATAIYEMDGKIHESQSNRAFFIAEQRKGDVEGY